MVIKKIPKHLKIAKTPELQKKISPGPHNTQKS